MPFRGIYSLEKYALKATLRGLVEDGRLWVDDEG